MTQFHSITSLQWLTLVGSLWLQSINGPNTDFPAYSSQLKHLLSLSQFELNNLAFASDAGKLFGWLSGIATLYLPLWLVLIIGSALGLIGYGVQFLFLVHKIPSLAYWHVFLLTVLAGNSSCWINTVCYIITIKNFPFDRQIAVGLSSGYVGLSAKIYTDIVDNVLASRKFGGAKAYLLLNSILPLLVSIIVAPMMREIEVVRKIKKGVSNYGFFMMFVITMATGVYAMLGSLGALHKLSLLVQAIGLGFLLAMPLVVPFSAWMRECVETKREAKKLKTVHDLCINDEACVEIDSSVSEVIFEVHESEMHDSCTNDEACVEIDTSVSKVIFEGHESEMVVGEREDIGVKLMVKRVEFWMYFFVYMFGGTLGLVFMNNLAQIAESRGRIKVSSLVSLSSSFGFFGRLVPSLLGYYLSRTSYMVSSVASIVALMVPMAGSFFLLLDSSSIALYMSTAIIGICSGAIVSIAVSTTTELFGAKNFSLNHNIVVVNIPIGSFLFGYLAAFIYQREVDAKSGRCIGVDCYRTTFIIWGCFCSFGTLLAFILYVKTRRFYLQLKLQQ